MYVTFRHVCVTIRYRGNAITVCRLSYPAFKAHAPYYIVICGLSGSTIFFHIQGRIFWGRGGKIMKIKLVFLYNFCLKHFILRFLRDTIAYVHNLHVKSLFLCQILTKPEFWKNTQISNFMKIR